MSKYYKTKENVVFDTIVNLVMIFTLLVCFLPFVYMAALSFSSSKAIINNQVLFWPVGFNLDAYKQIFTYPNFFQAYGNTFIYTIGGTTIAMLMTIMFAYPLSKDNLMGHKVFMKIVVISMFFAGGMIPQLPAGILFTPDRHPLGYAATLLHQPVQPDHHDQLFQISPARAGGSCSY